MLSTGGCACAAATHLLAASSSPHRQHTCQLRTNSSIGHQLTSARPWLSTHPRLQHAPLMLLAAPASKRHIDAVAVCRWLMLVSLIRDEVLLEVSFAAIWLAVAHQANKRTAQQQQQQNQGTTGAVKQPSDLPALSGQQQQPQPAQQLSAATLLLVKWLLFRLLLVGSTFSATYLCGQDPALGSCWKTLAAHGLPHAFTRWAAQVSAQVAWSRAHTCLHAPFSQYSMLASALQLPGTLLSQDTSASCTLCACACCQLLLLQVAPGPARPGGSCSSRSHPAGAASGFPGARVCPSPAARNSDRPAGLAAAAAAVWAREPGQYSGSSAVLLAA